MNTPDIQAASIISPLGRLILFADQDGIARIILPGTPLRKDEQRILDRGAGNHPVLERCCRELEEYFAGKRRLFSVPARPPGGTLFQRQVWQLLVRIPYGRTASYGALAEVLGNKKAARAVGRAANANPIPILVPCHRLIGRDGSLTGFASGLTNKSWLLEHEHALPPAS